MPDELVTFAKSQLLPIVVPQPHSSRSTRTRAGIRFPRLQLLMWEANVVAAASPSRHVV
jgi:hypothetical protein